MLELSLWREIEADKFKLTGARLELNEGTTYTRLMLIFTGFKSCQLDT